MLSRNHQSSNSNDLLLQSRWNIKRVGVSITIIRWIQCQAGGAWSFQQKIEKLRVAFINHIFIQTGITSFFIMNDKIFNPAHRLLYSLFKHRASSEDVNGLFATCSWCLLSWRITEYQMWTQGGMHPKSYEEAVSMSQSFTASRSDGDHESFHYESCLESKMHHESRWNYMLASRSGHWCKVSDVCILKRK